jgi:hypothetical protein
VRKHRSLLLLLPAILLAQNTFGSAIRELSGLTANILSRNDDSFVGPVNLGFTANVFGTTTTQVFVNNNGNFTVGTGLSAFTPGPIASSSTIMFAAFWGDVDTRVGNEVTFGTTNINGNAAFGAWWNDVGYFSQRTDRLNDFQLILISRADTCPPGLPTCGNFDIEYNYGQIQWETGGASGGVNGLGGNSARAGFTNATGTSFELAGSGINGAFLNGGPNALVAGSFNSAQAGRYVFEVRNSTIGTPGATQQNPVLPSSRDPNGQLRFNNVPTGRWSDPPGTFGFDYVGTGGTQFTSITLPTGFSNAFRVLTGPTFSDLLGTFTGGTSVNFQTLLGSAISAFRIVDIFPTVDTDANPAAFPLQIFFNGPTGSFTQTPLSEQPTSGVPEPSSLLMACAGISALFLMRRAAR